jgi:hypothetical protein
LSLPELRQVRYNQIIGSAPAITYDVNGNVSTITYSDGSSKIFTYSAGLLTQLDYTHGSPSRVYRKTFIYSANQLTSVTETII